MDTNRTQEATPLSENIRFRFSRDHDLQYIAHLDMLRLFERTVRRANLPISMTGGFNPRMKLVFGLPMSIGLSSDAEYADITLDQAVSPGIFIERMNQHLPKGLVVVQAVENNDKENIMARITAARYWVGFRSATEAPAMADKKAVTQEKKIEMEEKKTVTEDKQAVSEDQKAVMDKEKAAMAEDVAKLLAAEKIMVMKKGKKGLRPVDVRPFVYSASLVDGKDSPFGLEVFISAGSQDNLRPDLLFSGWEAITGKQYFLDQVHRLALYASLDNAWHEPTAECIVSGAAVVPDVF